MRGTNRYQRHYQINEDTRNYFMEAYADQYPIGQIRSIQNHWNYFSKATRKQYHNKKIQQVDFWNNKTHSGQYFKLVMPHHKKKLAIDNGYLYLPSRHLNVPGIDGSGKPIYPLEKYYQDIYQTYLDFKLEKSVQLPYGNQCNLMIMDYLL